MKVSKINLAIFLLFSQCGFSQIYFNLASQKFNQGNYSEAIYWANKSAETEPKELTNTLVIKGMSKTHLGDFEGADKDLLQLISLDRKNGGSYFNMSLNLLYQANYPLAIIYADTALSIDPNDYLTLSHKATLYSQIGEAKKAIETEKLALAIDSTCQECIINMGWFYFTAEEYANALYFYNKILSTNPYNTKTIANRGICYSALGQYDNAIADYDSVLTVTPKAIDILAKKGEALFQIKRFISSCLTFERLKVENDSVGTYYIKKYCDNREVVNYYPSGKVEGKGNYRNGQKEGQWNEWYESGKIRQEASVKNGKITGISTEYYENGQIKQKGLQVDDLTEGEWLDYYETGQLKRKVFFKNGKAEGLALFYYEDGKISGEYNLVNGKSEGEQKTYHPNGKLKMRVVSKNNVDVTKAELYDENGVLLKE
ncbi:hypothetical protein BH10BAC1_BH10BAC1_05350 [soil metagenome]